MPSQFTYEWSGSPFNPALQRKVDRLIRRALHDVVDYAEAEAKRLAPRRTGNLVRAIHGEDVRKVGNVWHTGLGIGRSAPYGKWVEGGTGLWGPHRSKIMARKPGGVMRFRMSTTTRAKIAKKDDVWIYRRSVRGQVGQRFIARAYRATQHHYMPARMLILQREIGKAIETRP